jgi:uncharacterized protein
MVVYAMFDLISQIKTFEWDNGNKAKCEKHGVSIQEIEALFDEVLYITKDEYHSIVEERFIGIGKINNRFIFVVFTLRQPVEHLVIRVLSACYMHLKEVTRYEQKNPTF